MTMPEATDLLDLALLAERSGRFDDARDLLRRAILLFGESPESLDARLRLGKLLTLGNPSHHAEAEAVLAEARAQAEPEGATGQASSAIHMLALLERHRRQPDRAERLLEESPVASHSAYPSPARAQWLQYKGLIESDRGNFNAAERYFFRAHQVYREVRDDLGLAEVCDSLANLLLRRGKSRHARIFALASLEQKHKLGDRYGEAITLGTLGRVALLQANYEDAADYFARDLAIALELGDTRGQGIMLNSLGEVALLRNQIEVADNYFRRAQAVEAGHTHHAHVWLGLARSHLAAGRLAEADQARAELEARLGQLPPSHGLHHAHLGLRGAIAIRLGEFAEAERLLELAIDAFRQDDAALDTIPWLYELRDLHQIQGSRAKAVSVMATALDLMSQCGSERGVEDVEDWLRKVDTPKLTRLALERHFPEHLIEEILGGRMRRPRSARQEVAVLFSDIRDYTTLTEGLEAELVVEILNEWFEEATRAIRKHGGVVDKFIGDAVMALFGIPEPRPDAAANAVRAALEMRDALATLNMRNQAMGGKELRIGIGIDCGEAVVGYIGSHLRQSYTAIGDTVNTASRLESMTKDRCDILISGAVETAQRSFHVAETRFEGKLKLKGREEEEPAYRVLALLDLPRP
jgi:class 3 adenylate cyclase